MDTDGTLDRRTLLAGMGTLVGGALAGCSEGDGNGDGNGDETTVEPSDEVDEYLSDANLYEGHLIDRTGRDAVEVAVGGGNGLAFDPPAIQVSTGTTITWEWTGEGGRHNVVSGKEQRNSDGPFYSGTAERGEDVTYEETVEEAGTYFYFCMPHRLSGMRGVVVVE